MRPITLAFVHATLFLCFTCASADEPRPFADKSSPVPHIHVESTSQFVRWTEPQPSLGAYDGAYYERHRLGDVAVGPNVKAHVDVIRDKVHFPSYYEIIRADTGQLLLRAPVFSLDDAELYFPGNGQTYLNQSHMALCGARHTRKFTLTAHSLAEVKQPIVYLGARTITTSTTPLFDSPSGTKVVASLPPNTEVVVLGLDPNGQAEERPVLLVKTPLGLTGWHRGLSKAGEGSLEIYQCN